MNLVRFLIININIAPLSGNLSLLDLSINSTNITAKSKFLC